MPDLLYVSPSPHIRGSDGTSKIMLHVILALVPSLVASIIIFGLRSLLVVSITVASCVLSEYISRKIMKRSNTTSDLSAVVTGMLLAFNLPSGVNLFIAAFGSVVAIVAVKQIFGGIGQNFVNPALMARIVLLLSFPAEMTVWAPPFGYANTPDAVASATPLSPAGLSYGYFDLLLGNRPGCLGETCILALLLGGIYLVITKVITPLIPLCYIGTVGILTFLLGGNPILHILSGGLVLGAVFMATDYTTTPLTNKGRVIFAAGCGVLTVLIRLYAKMPEGVSFSIILMNILTPHIESITQPKLFGKAGRHEKT